MSHVEAFPGVDVNPSEQEEFEEALEEHREVGHSRWSELEAQVPDVSEWHEFDQAGVASIRALFEEKAGLDVSNNLEQRMFFIPREHASQIGLRDEAGGKVLSSEDAIFVSFPIEKSNATGNAIDKYAMLVSPLHERFHSVGRQVVISQKQEVRGWVPWSRKINISNKDAQFGFVTSSSSEELRGSGLEEAVTYFYSEKLLMESTDPIMLRKHKEALTNILSTVGDENKIAILEKMTSDEFRTFSATFRKQFIEDLGGDTEEWGFYRLYEALLERATSLGICAEFEKQILTTRIDPSNTRALFQTLKSVTGDPEVARKIFKLSSDDSEELNSLIDYLHGFQE